MINVTLTGGNFGGEVVSISAMQTLIEKTDANGVIWQYEVRAELSGLAIFIGVR